jgi:uncharacterized membrane protein YbhN (UPF0104 family)
VPWVGLGWPAPSVKSTAGIGAFITVALIIIGHRFLAQFKNDALARVFIYGMVIQSLQLGCTAALLAFMQLPLHHYWAFLAVFLISSIAAALPLSFGGIGVREITFFYCLRLLKLDPTYGVAASSSFFLITMASSLLGGAFFLNTRLERDA